MYNRVGVLVFIYEQTITAYSLSNLSLTNHSLAPPNTVDDAITGVALCNARTEEVAFANL